MSNDVLITSMNKCLFNFWGESNCITPATICVILFFTGILLIALSIIQKNKHKVEKEDV